MGLGVVVGSWKEHTEYMNNTESTKREEVKMMKAQAIYRAATSDEERSALIEVWGTKIF